MIDNSPFRSHRVGSAVCPACGMEYKVDLKNNRKGGFQCYGCGQPLSYNPADISLSIAQGVTA